MKMDSIYHPSEWILGEGFNTQGKARSTAVGFGFVFQKKQIYWKENSLIRSLEQKRI